VKPDVRLIAAVGRRGQLGLGGRLPWNDPEDLQWFRARTTGHVVLMGKRTAEGLNKDLSQRTVVVWDGTSEPEHVINRLNAQNRMERQAARIIWIAGGAHTYRSFMPFVRYSVISHIDFNGDADVWMPELWGSR
jgi:dihydromethanopterin reductase